ncbi:hypothetical protein AN958_11927 [Leucoagaricus sp. SymC.cos]|nr:hypothetical protein AN958_11927 [Leucoagaricus sp. SymC.cos]
MTLTRESIRQLLKPLQRVRPRTPFWNIPAHRVPTLRLYKNLLQEAPTNAIRFRIRLLWRENKSLTSIERTRNALRQGYKFLDIFQRANNGDTHLQKLLRRYSRLIDVRCEKEYWDHLVRKELVWRAKLRYRPIVTGGYFSSSIFHKPLPRMIHQPTRLSQMIHWRYQAYERRIQRHQSYFDILSDLRHESRLQKAFAKPGSSSDLGGYPDWVSPNFCTKLQASGTEKAYKNELDVMQEHFDRGTARARTPFSPELLDQLKTARKERVLNKTRERNRELRGEMTRSLLKRLRKGPPAHILHRMSPRDRYWDQIARHPSEVGFTAMVKRKLGYGFKNPDAWIVEESRDKKAALDAISAQILEQNRMNRRSMDARLQDDSTL